MFCSRARIEGKFAVNLPDSLPNEIACLLLYGGGKVYELSCDYGAPSKKVGVMGIGGLGTAAIRLGKLRRCIMFAISGSESKRRGVLAAGAHHFIYTANQEELDSINGALDVIIDTTQSTRISKVDGIYCRVGAMPAKNQTYTGGFIPLVFYSHRVTGSCVTGSLRIKEMLELVTVNLGFVKDIDEWKTEQVPHPQPFRWSPFHAWTPLDYMDGVLYQIKSEEKHEGLVCFSGALKELSRAFFGNHDATKKAAEEEAYIAVEFRPDNDVS